MDSGNVVGVVTLDNLSVRLGGERLLKSIKVSAVTAWHHVLCEQVRGLTETDQFSNLRHLFSKGVPCVRDAAGLQAECVSPVLRMSCSDRKRS
jgi:hypothetical protein